MRVHLVDPSAFTPPYDHALAAALVRAGADVDLVTSRFLYGPTPEPRGYRVDERFYGVSARPLVHRMDAVVVHSGHGAERLESELDLPADRIRVIPHGAFDHYTRIADPRPLPAELARVEGPVILCFGLMRPYKGIDVLLEAFRE